MTGSRRGAALLVALIGVAGAYTFLNTAGQNLYADELAIFSFYRDFDPHTLLQASAGHLVLTSVVAYQGLFAIFGAGSYLPIRLLHIVLASICAGLFYVLARRRIGPLAALGPTAVLLLLGGAGEVVATPFGSLAYMGVVFGLAALVTIERDSRAADIATALAFAAGMASYTINLAFGAGLAVYIWRRGPGRRWRDSWMLWAPLLVYSGWRVWAHPSGETNISLENVGGIASAMYTSLAAAVATITGLFSPPGGGTSIEWGYPLAAVAIGLFVLRLRRPDPVSTRFWALAVILVSYWALLATNLGPLRSPESGRYEYISAVPLLLLLIEMAAGLPRPRWAGPALAAALALSLLSNCIALQQAGSQYRLAGEIMGADLGAIDLAGAAAAQAEQVLPLPDVPVLHSLRVPLGDYRAAVRRFGSPGDSIAELGRGPEIARTAADQQLVRLLHIHTQPLLATNAAPGAGAGPVVAALRGGTVAVHQRCLALRPAPASSPARLELTLPPGGISLRVDPGPPVSISVRRFASGASVPLRGLAGGATTLLRIPGDRSPKPWTAVLDSSQGLGACPA